jgi:hypothetical protein
MMNGDLPPDIAQGASLRGNEYAWDLSAFPNALTKAEALGYACLGGQFQFRLDDGICEMYWLNADSNERAPNEPWVDYCRRSCKEVLSAFQNLATNTDFKKEALGWLPIKAAMTRGSDPLRWLVFVAYFVNETEATLST